MSDILNKDNKVFTADRDVYYMTRLWDCFNTIGIGFGGKEVDELTFTRWIQSARVVTYFKRLNVPVSLYERAKALNQSNKKFVSSLLILYLTEVLGSERANEIIVSFNREQGTNYRFVLRMFLEPGDIVNYELNSTKQHDGNVQLEMLYIRDIMEK